MKRFFIRARLVIGGAVLGGLLGVPPGAAFGLVYGCWVGNPGYGLDGALTMAVAFGLLGAGYGLAVALAENGTGGSDRAAAGA